MINLKCVILCVTAFCADPKWVVVGWAVDLWSAADLWSWVQFLYDMDRCLILCHRCSLPLSDSLVCVKVK